MYYNLSIKKLNSFMHSSGREHFVRVYKTSHSITKVSARLFRRVSMPEHVFNCNFNGER